MKWLRFVLTSMHKTQGSLLFSHKWKGLWGGLSWRIYTSFMMAGLRMTCLPPCRFQLLRCWQGVNVHTCFRKQTDWATRWWCVCAFLLLELSWGSWDHTRMNVILFFKCSRSLMYHYTACWRYQRGHFLCFRAIFCEGHRLLESWADAKMMFCQRTVINIPQH